MHHSANDSSAGVYTGCLDTKQRVPQSTVAKEEKSQDPVGGRGQRPAYEKEPRTPEGQRVPARVIDGSAEPRTQASLPGQCATLTLWQEG